MLDSIKEYAINNPCSNYLVQLCWEHQLCTGRLVASGSWLNRSVSSFWQSQCVIFGAIAVQSCVQHHSERFKCTKTQGTPETARKTTSRDFVDEKTRTVYAKSCVERGKHKILKQAKPNRECGNQLDSEAFMLMPRQALTHWKIATLWRSAASANTIATSVQWSVLASHRNLLAFDIGRIFAPVTTNERSFCTDTKSQILMICLLD